ncbi:hypothetical protein ACIBAH_35115 [Streptomyces sp. NPDC051445]|uniref:hypothetical protein n=1 Tax=Streptomyces sp. NPDC051445 TaxID=3365653 RepID=UPI0037A1D923
MNRHPSDGKSLALRAFLTELSLLTQKYGFYIPGSPYDPYENPGLRGNGVARDLIYDENSQEYDAV